MSTIPFQPQIRHYLYKSTLAGLYSYALAGKEPNRDDFEAGIAQQPKAERLQDLELGVEKDQRLFVWRKPITCITKINWCLQARSTMWAPIPETNIPTSYWLVSNCRDRCV